MARKKIAAALLLLAAGAAHAQDSAVTVAADAFGERVGTEQSGLYSETQVRGFDLTESGAYRIDDAYFIRTAALNDPVLAGVGVRVGVNAVRLAYPAPSGVVDYRLREAGPTNQIRLGVGLRDFGTRVVQGDGSWRDGDLGFAGGFVWRPQLRLPYGNEGDAFDLGGVGAWQLAPAQRLRAFATMYRRAYDGDYAVIPGGSAVPPNLEALRNYSPSWARTAATNSNFGVLYDGRFGEYTVDATAFRSRFAIDRSDYTLISADADGIAAATDYRNPGITLLADSAEVRVGGQFETGALSQLATVSVRGGRKTVDLTSNLEIPLGTFDLQRDATPAGIEQPWSGTRGTDTAEQVTASAGYGLAWRERLQLRFGAHRTRYDKHVLTVVGVRTAGINDTSSFDASAVYGFTDRTTLFGSWVTGLEQAGVAPTSATNRDDVLPPVEARQIELGVRYAFTPGLTFIGALFDVSKPTSGFRADRSFGVVGEVRHRGVEASLSGSLGSKTSVVLGAVAFQPRVSGPLVDAGVVGTRAAGISHVIVNANVERRLCNGWSVDAAVGYFGKRWADTANTFETPSVTTVSLGARCRFTLGRRPADFRILGSNLTGTGGYWASPSGVLTPIAPRTVRALFTVTLGPAPPAAP